MFKSKWEPTIAAVPQVGPDDVFLREAEDSQSSSSHRGVYDDACICHHLRTLVEANSEGAQRAATNQGQDLQYAWVKNKQHYTVR